MLGNIVINRLIESPYICTEGGAIQMDIVQQSMVNEEYRMSFKKEERV